MNARYHAFLSPVKVYFFTADAKKSSDALTSKNTWTQNGLSFLAKKIAGMYTSKTIKNKSANCVFYNEPIKNKTEISKEDKNMTTKLTGIKKIAGLLLGLLMSLTTLAGIAQPTMAATNPSITSISASNISVSQARVDFSTSNPSKLYVAQCGIQIRKKGAAKWTTKTDNVSKSYGVSKTLKSYYIIGSGKEVNFKLEANATYEYRGFCKVQNGSPIYSGTKTFKVTGRTIYGNGTGGISIDINKAPYSTKNSNIAYSDVGCTWFAACRVQQLTGKSVAIYGPQQWYKSAYATVKFKRGQTIRGRALACYANHVLVIEKVSGNTVYISEGGCKGWGCGAANGYCRIAKVSKSDITGKLTQYNGKFLGYVYLP